MRDFKDSDLFMNVLNKNNVITGKIFSILGNSIPSIILNKEIYPDIKRRIIDKKKNKVSAEIGKFIVDGSFVLFAVEPEFRLPDAIPFFTFKQNGKKLMGINLSNVAIKRKFDNGEVYYDISDNIDKTYAILHSAYIAYTKLDPRTVLSPTVLSNSAILWSTMFTKPLYDSLGLHNPDRKMAFMYFSIKFFLKYYMDCPDIQVENMATGYVGKKNDLILYMEDEIKHRGINIYEGLLVFLETMLNDEISMTKGVRVNTLSKTMNTSYYLRRFNESFSSGSMMSLCAYPYFVYTLIAAYSKCKLVRDKSFDNIFSDNSKILNKLMVELLRD